MAKKRLLVVANVPGPNLNDFYDQVSDHSNIEIIVLYCSKKTKKWKEGVVASKGHPHKFLFNLNIFSKYARFQINPGIIKYLLFNRPDVVQIQGYNTPTLFISLFILKLFKVPFIYWGEMINRSDTSNKISLKLKENVVKILNSSERVYVVGTDGVESYKRLGIQEDLLKKLSYSCDLSKNFAVSLARDKLDKQGFAIVTTSQLVYRKRVDLLIKAFVTLADEFPSWNLNIIGDGNLKDQLTKLIPAKIESRVKWYGYLKKDKHPSVYSESDIFVLASREDGGPMVLPEAMGTGLPIITTNGVATASEIVQEGVNGYIIEKDSLEELTLRLKMLMNDQQLRVAMGKASAEKATRWDAKYVATKYVSDLRAQVFDKS